MNLDLVTKYLLRSAHRCSLSSLSVINATVIWASVVATKTIYCCDQCYRVAGFSVIDLTVVCQCKYKIIVTIKMAYWSIQPL